MLVWTYEGEIPALRDLFTGGVVLVTDFTDEEMELICVPREGVVSLRLFAFGLVDKHGVPTPEGKEAVIHFKSLL